MVEKTKSFRFEKLDKALIQLNKEDSMIIAGGTDVMVLHRNQRGLPAKISKPVVFIDHLTELKQVYVQGNDLHIGACSTFSELLENPSLPAVFKKAISVIAAPAIRNRGTLGGNICNASPAGDTLPLLYIFNAKLLLRSVNGERLVDISDFIHGPRRIQRESNELLVEIILPEVLKVEASSHIIFEKIANRNADAIAKVEFAGLLRVRNDRIEDARLAFGAVGPTIIRSVAIEKKLLGKPFPLDKAVIAETIADFDQIIKPIDDQRSTATYRKKVALNLLQYCLEWKR